MSVTPSIHHKEIITITSSLKAIGANRLSKEDLQALEIMLDQLESDTKEWLDLYYSPDQENPLMAEELEKQLALIEDFLEICSEK